MGASAGGTGIRLATLQSGEHLAPSGGLRGWERAQETAFLSVSGVRCPGGCSRIFEVCLSEASFKEKEGLRSHSLTV